MADYNIDISMVKSELHPNKINYNESKQIDEEDIGYASPRYETTNFTVPIEIALGKEKHTYSSHNIIYFSVYLIIDNMIKDKIGIVEIESSRFIDSLDEDGDFILDNGNLIFFVDDDYIIGMMKDVMLSEKDDNAEDSEDDDSDEEDEELDPIKIEDDIILGDIETLDTEDVLAVDIPEEKRSNVAEKTEKELENGLFEMMDSLPSVETLVEENNLLPNLNFRVGISLLLSFVAGIFVFLGYIASTDERFYDKDFGYWSMLIGGLGLLITLNIFVIRVVQAVRFQLNKEKAIDDLGYKYISKLETDFEALESRIRTRIFGLESVVYVVECKRKLVEAKLEFRDLKEKVSNHFK